MGQGELNPVAQEKPSDEDSGEEQEALEDHFLEVFGMSDDDNTGALGDELPDVAATYGFIWAFLRSQMVALVTPDLDQELRSIKRHGARSPVRATGTVCWEGCVWACFLYPVAALVTPGWVNCCHHYQHHARNSVNFMGTVWYACLWAWVLRPVVQ